MSGDAPTVARVADVEEAPSFEIDGVAFPRAALRVLTACATAPEVCLDLPFRDPVAERIFAAVGARPAAFNPSELACTAFRALLVDRMARCFFARHPGGLGVGVLSGLGTRAHRLSGLCWVDVDVPAVANVRRQLVPRIEGWRQLEACFCQSTWLDAVSRMTERPLLLVVDESTLPIPHEVLARLLDHVSLRAPRGTELLVAFDAGAPLAPSATRGRAPALELRPRSPNGKENVARYPRLRFVDEDIYPDDIAIGLMGVNVVSEHYGGSVPSLSHLVVW